MFAAVLAVLVGGMIGTAARLAASALVTAEGGFPIATLLVNVSGSLVLGVLVGRAWRSAPVWLRAGLGPGLLGSFTTFSALTVGIVSAVAGGRMLAALIDLALSLVLGLAAAVIGLVLGNAGLRNRVPIEAQE